MERSGRLPAAGGLVLVGFACFLVAGIGLSFARPGVSTETFWPATGVLTAALLLSPLRQWLGISLAAFVGLLAAQFLAGQPVYLALASGLGTLTECLLGAALVRHFGGPDSNRLDLTSLMTIVGLAGLAAPLLGASVAAVARLPIADRPEIFTAWAMDWFAGMIGVVVGVPLVLSAITGWESIRRSSRARWVEGTVMAFTVLTVAGFVFWEPFDSLSFAYLIPLILFWPAFRFGVLGVSVVLAVLVPLAVRGTLAGYGPMSGSDNLSPGQQVLLLQAFLATHALTFLFLTVVLVERRTVLAALREANRDLEERVRRRTEDLAHANRGLLEKTKLFERIAETTPDVLYLQDLTTGRNVYTNNQITQVLGYTPEQILAFGNRVLAETIVPEDMPRIESRLRDLASAPDGVIVESEFRIRTAAGRIRWVRTRSVIFTRLADGRAHLILGLMHDISDLKSAAEALTESERHYRALADTSPGLRWIMSPSGRVTAANARWTGYIGADVPADGQDWAELLHPDDRDRFAQLLERHFADGTAFETEFRLRRHDGVYHWFLTRGVASHAADGTIDRWFGTSTDIQSRKLAEIALNDSEARYRAVFDQTALGIVLCMTDGRFLSVNPGFLELTGFTIDELADRTILEVIAPDDREQIADTVAGMIARGEPSVAFNHRFLRQDDTLVPVRATVTAVRGRDGKVTHTIAIVHDETDRIRVEAAIRGAEAHVRAVIDTLFSDVIVMTPDGTVESANAAAAETAEQSRESLIGRKLWELPPWTRDEALGSDLQAACERARWGETYRADRTISRADGRSVVLDLHLAPMRDAAGQVTHLVFSARDVTSRIELETALRESQSATAAALAQFQSHMQNSPLAMIEWDADFRVKQWSGSAERIFGWTAADVVGKAPHEWPFVHTSDRDAVAAVMEELISGSKVNNICRNRNYRKDGSVVHSEWYNSAIRDAEGRLISILSRVLDNSYRIAAESRTEESRV